MIIDQDLYQQFVRTMPLSCVDLLVVDGQGRVLLAKRANEPAKGEWWFPGGRVYYLETRLQAAERKLKEECGLEADPLIELGTYDVIVPRSDDSSRIHGITTLFQVNVGRRSAYVLDSQNFEADWRYPKEWLRSQLNPFIQIGLKAFIDRHVLEHGA